MKALILAFTLIPFTFTYAEEGNSALLKEFHKMSITHCDDFINEHTRAAGNWKFFINKHDGGIDGPSTEVYMVQISGNSKQTYKTDFTFIQTLKKCFVHKRGQITVNESCDKAVSPDVWKVQYNLPGFSYKRYKDKKGIILYAKETGPQSCLLEYEFRASGDHSVYIPIK